MTRNLVTTAVVPASHLDVISGLHLARRLAMLFRSNHEVYNLTQICPDAPLDEEYLVLRYCTYTTGTGSQRGHHGLKRSSLRKTRLEPSEWVGDR